MQKNWIFNRFNDILKARELLRNSTDEYLPYDVSHIYTPKELQYYDALSFRYERYVELSIDFFRTLELYLNAKSSDTLRDRLLVMQKLNFIDEIECWIEARLLRNRIAEAYSPDEIRDIYPQVIDSSPAIFATLDRIRDYLEQRVEKE